MSYSLAMAIESILAQIDAEISRLTQVRELLAGAGKFTLKVPGKSAAGEIRRKRFLSPEARKRIADAQKRRWAAQKSKAKRKAK